MRRLIREFTRLGRKNEFIWRYGFNFSSSVKYGLKINERLTSLETDLVECLNRDGIVIIAVDDLIGEKRLFQQLRANTLKILEQKKTDVRNLEAKAALKKEIGKKTFNLELLGSELNFDTENIFARFALDNTLLNIANSYFQMYAKLRYYNVWKTFATSGGPRESQLWHFDREDKFILKLFLYLDDVDEGSGPFTYAPETHQKGRLKNIRPEFSLECGVRRTTDEQMNAVFPKKNWKVATGRKGTLILADTRGFHKGGEARTKDRLMYTCMYTSGASESKKLIRYPPDLNLETLSEKQREAIWF